MRQAEVLQAMTHPMLATRRSIPCYQNTALSVTQAMAQCCVYSKSPAWPIRLLPTTLKQGPAGRGSSTTATTCLLPHHAMHGAAMSHTRRGLRLPHFA